MAALTSTQCADVGAAVGRLAVRDGRVSRSPGGGGGFRRGSVLGHSTALVPLAHRRCHFTMCRLLRSGLPVCPSLFLGFSRICFSFIFCFDVSQCIFVSYISLASRFYFCSLSPLSHVLCARRFFASVHNAPPWRFLYKNEVLARHLNRCVHACRCGSQSSGVSPGAS